MLIILIIKNLFCVLFIRCLNIFLFNHKIYSWTREDSSDPANTQSLIRWGETLSTDLELLAVLFLVFLSLVFLFPVVLFPVSPSLSVPTSAVPICRGKTWRRHCNYFDKYCNFKLYLWVKKRIIKSCKLKLIQNKK